MPKSKISEQSILESVKYNTAIWKQFQKLKVPLSRKATLPTDLGDIREVCCQYITAFDRLLSDEAASEWQVLTEVLRTIRNDLYIHLGYHLRQLKRPLNILIDELEKQGDAKNSQRIKNQHNKKSKRLSRRNS
jgi:hypothetical protein